MWVLSVMKNYLIRQQKNLDCCHKDCGGIVTLSLGEPHSMRD
jgi:hypothetical protein